MIVASSSPAAARPFRFALLGPAAILAFALAGALPTAASAAPAKPTFGARQPVAVTTTPEQELREVDAARFATLVAGDTAKLKTVLGEDLSYTHSTGEVQDREQYLGSLTSGQLRYESMAPSDVLVRVYGSTGVVTGRVDMKVAIDGQDKMIAARYTAVYVRRDLRWQLVAWQSSPIAAATQTAS